VPAPGPGVYNTGPRPNPQHVGCTGFATLFTETSEFLWFWLPYLFIVIIDYRISDNI